MRLPLLLAAGTLATAIHATQPPPSAPAAMAAPLEARSVTPGVGRCTSDGACTVTDDQGTRAAAPLRVFP